MALCRCKKEHGPPKGKRYVAYVLPVGYPNTALVCGNPRCDLPSVIWLMKDEVVAYKKGQRIFKGATNVSKFKAKDNSLVMC